VFFAGFFQAIKLINQQRKPKIFPGKWRQPSQTSWQHDPDPKESCPVRKNNCYCSPNDGGLFPPTLLGKYDIVNCLGHFVP